MQLPSLDPFEFAARRFEQKGASVYFRDPVGFARDCIAWKIGESLADYQEETLQDLQDSKKVAVRGPHGLGKTTTKAIATLWFALTREAEGIDWKVITTAGAWRQLQKFLWPEIHKWAGRLRWDVLERDPFDARRELLDLNLKLHYGAASAVATDKKELIEGAHAEQILYIFDESKAISNDVFDAAEGAFSGAGVGGAEAYALAQSTPGEPSGRFYDIHARKPGLRDWKIKHVTAARAMSAGRMSADWKQARKEQWGEESAVYQNRVLGEFFASSEDVTIPLAWVEAANERWLVWNDAGRPEPAGRKIVGIDVARGGSDLSVLSERQGPIVLSITRMAVADTLKVADAGRMMMTHQTDLAVVDVIGVGAGIVDTYRRQSVPVIAFNASRSNKMRDRSGEFPFLNNRATMWWTLREMLDPAFSPELAFPPDDELTGELTAPKWWVTAGGKIAVESKDDIRKRLGRSTDTADSVGQTLMTDRQFDEPDQPEPKPIPYSEAPLVNTSSLFTYSDQGFEDFNDYPRG